jgi:hypothetical protein
VLDAVVSKADFARRCGVTRGRVSQWIHDGQIGVEALDGTGPRARIRADVAIGMLRDRLDWFRGGSVADLGGSRGDDVAQKFRAAAAAQKFRGAAARTRAVDLQRELLEIKLARLKGELIPRAASIAGAESLGRATQRALKGIVGWNEELLAAGQNGGLAAISALLRAKSFELCNTVADMLTADAEFEPPEGATNV